VYVWNNVLSNRGVARITGHHDATTLRRADRKSAKGVIFFPSLVLPLLLSPFRTSFALAAFMFLWYQLLDGHD
jgi:hypothetical protein